MPDSLVGGGYVEVALEGDGHQGVRDARVGNLEKGVGVDHEDRAEVILEVSREFGRRVINQACCQCEDIDEREQDEQICKSWREVEAVASAEQDCQADEIAYDARNGDDGMCDAIHPEIHRIWSPYHLLFMLKVRVHCKIIIPRST